MFILKIRSLHKKTHFHCKVCQAFFFPFYSRLFSHQHYFKSTMLERRDNTGLPSVVINLSTTGPSIVTATFGEITATTELKVESRQQHTDDGGGFILTPPQIKTQNQFCSSSQRENTNPTLQVESRAAGGFSKYNLTIRQLKQLFQ